MQAPVLEMPGRGTKDPRLWLDSSDSNDVRSRVDKYKLEHSRSSKHTFAPGETPEGLHRPVRPPPASPPLKIPGFVQEGFRDRPNPKDVLGPRGVGVFLWAKYPCEETFLDRRLAGETAERDLH